MDSLFRSIFFILDRIIYGLIPTVYNFVMTMARVDLFKPSAIQTLANNIYAILGLFLIFRLAFVLLNAIIDPEKLTDKNSGFGKMMTNFVVALVLIVVIPWGFDLSKQLQTEIIENDVIVRIFLGERTDRNNPGQNMGSLSLQSFLSINEGLLEKIGELQNVGDLYTITGLSGDEVAYAENYYKGFNAAFPRYINGAPETPPTFDNLADILNDKYQSPETNTKIFVYDYKMGISTICGIIILVMLVMLSFDVAVRVVKLGFLQIITPVAVMGYIEPKQELFKRWLDMCVKTYINLFIRIVAISFITYAMSAISLNNLGVPDIKPGTKLLIQIFLIVGLLIFAKELPKMLGTLFKLDEGSIGSLNPFARLKGMAGAGLIGGAAALGLKGVGGLTGAIGGGIGAKAKKGSFWAGAGQGGLQGLKNVKLKDAVKGGLGGLGKTFAGSTFGAFGKGRDYAAGKVTGKEEKLGAFGGTRIRDQVAAYAQELHTGKETKDFEAKGKNLRSAIDNRFKTIGDGKLGWSRQSDGKGKYLESNEAVTRRRMHANDLIFDNQEFSQAYSDYKIYSAQLKDKKVELSDLQDNLARAEAVGDQGEMQRYQSEIWSKSDEISKMESGEKKLSEKYEELKKKDYNKKNVENLEALDAHNSLESARKSARGSMKQSTKAKARLVRR